MSNQQSRSTARTVQIRFGPVIGRQIIPLGIVILIVWLLRDRIPRLDPAEIFQTIQQVKARQWGVAGIATLISFWAVGRYDQVMHGLMGTEIHHTQARLSGTSAVAIAQFAGFGVLTGALVRWRMLPGVSLSCALRVSAAVSVSFLGGWAIVSSGAVLVIGPEFFDLRLVAGVVLALFALFALVLIVQPKILGQLPGIGAVFTIVLLVFIDTLFAGAALYVLLPESISLNPYDLYFAFLIALGAGLIGGTPAGIGPFELILLALLPGVAQEPLLASALAFRIVYYVLPAGLALAALLWGPKFTPNFRGDTMTGPLKSAFLLPKLERVFWTAPSAEVNLIRQGEFGLLSDATVPQALVATVGQSLIMLADPIACTRTAQQTVLAFQASAKRQFRSPLIYKCTARTALAARSLGWAVLPIAQEAWLNPAGFSTDGANHRQLRRFLRKAGRSGITVVEAGRRLPLDEMEKISNRWALDHGGEKGFSMGKFGRNYVSCQRVFLAYKDDTLVAFITLHEVQKEWTLDLMRHAPNIPDGTMHLLVQHAINSAAAVFCPRFSLSAVPHPQANEPVPVARLRRHLLRVGNSAGLRRFKASFSPNWQPLYAAAPGKTGLLLGLGAAIARINRDARWL